MLVLLLSMLVLVHLTLMLVCPTLVMLWLMLASDCLTLGLVNDNTIALSAS